MMPLLCVCNVRSAPHGGPGTCRDLRFRSQQNTTRRALVTGRTSFRTDGSGPLPGPSVAFSVETVHGEDNA